MKRLPMLVRVVALLGAVGTALPACAQHGGGHGGGGFAGHSSAPAFHASAPVSSGFRPSAPSGARPAPYGMKTAPNYPGRSYANRSYPGAAYQGRGYAGSRYLGAPRSYSTGAPIYPYAYSASSARRAIPNGQHSPNGNHQPSYRRPYRNQDGRGRYRVAYSGAYLGWPTPYYLGDPYFDPYSYDDSYDSSIDGGYYGDQSTAPYNQPDDPRYDSGFDPERDTEPNRGYDLGYDSGYGQAYSPQYAPGTYPAAPADPSDPSASGSNFRQEPAPIYRPQYQPSSANARPASPPAAQPTVTLVFKDGRPAEQIHNYLLSRDSITVWDKPDGGLPREIRIDQLNILATEKANNEAGVDFYLPRNIQ